MKSEGSQIATVDSVASGLLASVVVSGVLVLGLFLAWLSTRESSRSFNSLVGNESGRGDHAEGYERDILPAGAEDAERLTEPSTDQQVQSISDFSSVVAASFDSVTGDTERSFGANQAGDRRPPGPLGEGDGLVPKHQRWELKFQSGSLQKYARQLDHFGIELACVGKSAYVDYATGLSSAPQKRSRSSDEQNKLRQLFFIWRNDSPLKQFDELLLKRAGIETSTRLILKFIPKSVESEMEKLESIHFAKQGYSSVNQVAQTVFQVRESSNGFEIVVAEQTYRLTSK